MRVEGALERFLVQLEADGRSLHTIGQYRHHVLPCMSGRRKAFGRREPTSMIPRPSPQRSCNRPENVFSGFRIFFTLELPLPFVDKVA